MAFEIITLPLLPTSNTFNADILNKFCANKKIISQQRSFFQQGGNSFWSIFIEYEPILEPAGQETAQLTEAEKKCYEELRRWRNERAEQEGIPSYVIAKNAHLVEIIQKKIKSLEALKQIYGFGAKKMEKYGSEIIAIIQNFFKEKPIQNDT